MTRNEVIQKWTEDVRKHLEGATIVSVRYLTHEEMQDLGWYNRSIVILLRKKDGTMFNIFPSADDEGNDAGALFTDLSDLPTIPVI